MTRLHVLKTLAFAGLSWALMLSPPNAPGGQTTATVDRVVLSRSLPAMKGDDLKITLVEIAYAPGAASRAHSHPCPVVAYVVSGAIRSQVKGEPATVYQAGESFFEPANGVHLVSENASKTAPAKFLAYFLCDHETKLSAPPVDGAKANPESTPQE